MHGDQKRQKEVKAKKRKNYVDLGKLLFGNN